MWKKIMEQIFAGMPPLAEHYMQKQKKKLKAHLHRPQQLEWQKIVMKSDPGGKVEDTIEYKRWIKFPWLRLK